MKQVRINLIYGHTMELGANDEKLDGLLKELEQAKKTKQVIWLRDSESGTAQAMIDGACIIAWIVGDAAPMVQRVR